MQGAATACLPVPLTTPPRATDRPSKKTKRARTTRVELMTDIKAGSDVNRNPHLLLHPRMDRCSHRRSQLRSATHIHSALQHRACKSSEAIYSVKATEISALERMNENKT